MLIDERMRKWYLLGGFLLISGLFGAALFFLFFRSQPVPSVPGTPTPAPLSGTLPGAGKATPGAIVSSTVPGFLPSGVTRPGSTGPSTPSAPPKTVVLNERVTQYLSASPTGNGFRSYNGDDGKFYRILADGTKQALSDQAFYDVKDVSWGKTSDKAVLEFPDGSNILYDFSNNRQVTLPKHWTEFDFSPNDQQVIAKSLGNNESNRFLVIANNDGSGAHAIQELGDNASKVQVAWSPNNQVVAYSHTGDAVGFDRESIILIGQNQENYKALITEGRGFLPNWSPSGNHLLYSVYTSDNGYLPQLWVSGGTGDNMNANRRRIELNTWADKCTWASEDVIYCGVPSSLGVGAGLQRDSVPAGPDSIVKIDLKTGTNTNLGQPDGNHTIQKLTLSADQKTAFFTDRITGQFIRFDLTR